MYRFAHSHREGLVTLMAITFEQGPNVPMHMVPIPGSWAVTCCTGVTLPVSLLAWSQQYLLPDFIQGLLITHEI